MDIDQSKPIIIKGDPEIIEALAKRFLKNGFNDEEPVNGCSPGKIAISDDQIKRTWVFSNIDFQVVNANQHWPELRELKPVQGIRKGQYYRWKSGEVFRIEELFLSTRSCIIRYLNGVEKRYFLNAIRKAATANKDGPH